MKQKFILFLTFILLLSISFFLILPYIENQKEIKQYAFKMNSFDGEVSLNDYDGKYKIIFFGYMYCPDICPTSLSLVANALSVLPKEDADLFQLIFISVDPKRDKLKDLKEYANYFHKGAIGITSNESYLKDIGAKYGAYYAKEYLKDSKINYSVAHTSFVYIMDKDGKLIHKLKHLEKSSDILDVLKNLK